MENREFAHDGSNSFNIFGNETYATPEPPSSRSSHELANNAGVLPPGAAHRLVKRDLDWYHIFLIVISGTIGMGLFDNSGEILGIAGPVGALISYIIVGIGVICVMEGIAEMIGHWPIANAMVEFVKAFVDKDLAIVVGLAYWYAYAISFASLIIAAANLASYWDWSPILQDFIFIGGAPLLLLAINCLGVLWYGNVEAIMGMLKLTLVLGSFLTMLIINNENLHADTPNGKIQSTFWSEDINDGFQNNPAVASNRAIAVLVTIPIVAYGYIGVEIVAVTALEAKDPRKSLKYPAKLIAWLTTAIYFLSALGFYLNVPWFDLSLPALSGRVMHGTTVFAPNTNTTQTSSVLVIAVLNASIPTLPGFINGCLIMAVLSAANTALYVSSRTLFGLTREIDPDDKYWWWIAKLSTTTPHRKVPAAALFLSTAAFCWVPFLHLSKSYSDQDLQEIMSGVATVGVVLVWGSQCLAFIRYRMWLRRFRKSRQLIDDYPEYNHWSAGNTHVPFSTTLGWLQPIPAYFGLIFCILTVFVFASAPWWNGGEKHIDIVSACVGPAVLLIFWLILKLLRYGDNFEWYVKLGTWEQLQERLDRLSSAIVVDRVTSNETDHGEVMFPMNAMTQTPLSPQRRANGMPGFDPARDSGYYSPRAGTGLGVRTDIHAGGSRTPSPKAPIPSVRSYDPRPGMGRPPSDALGIPRRRPVGAPTTIPMPPAQHYHHQQQHQSQMAYEEPVIMGDDRRPTFLATTLQPGWGSTGHVYTPVSPSTRGINIEHENDAVRSPPRGINIEHEYDAVRSPPRGGNMEHGYDAVRSPPRGGNMEHGYGAVPSSPRDRHNV